MKIIFFSDIHGNQHSYYNFTKALETECPDLIVFGGDVFGYYYGQNEIIDDMRRRNIHMLLGNHDDMFLQLLDNKIDRQYLISRYGNTYQGIEKRISERNIQFLRQITSEYYLEVDGLKLYFAHGAKHDPLNGRVYPDTDILDVNDYQGVDFAFLGHTHHKIVKKCGECTIINPGSLGQQRDGKGCKYVSFDTQSKEITFHVVEYCVDDLVQEIEKKDEGAMRNRLVEPLYRSR